MLSVSVSGPLATAGPPADHIRFLGEQKEEKIDPEEREIQKITEEAFIDTVDKEGMQRQAEVAAELKVKRGM